MGEAGIFPELCAPLSLWGGIHPAPVIAKPPLEELYPQGGPHLFPSPLPPHPGRKKSSLSLLQWKLKTLDISNASLALDSSLVQVACLGEKWILVSLHQSSLCVRTQYRWVMRGLEV